jgi:hypothetical protein
LLLNLVKLRYGDTSFFLDVASITNSYGLETQVSLAANWWENVIGVAASIDVPPSHVEEGRTYGTKAFETDGPGGFRPMIRVQSGPQRPGDAFVTIQYRGHWFWVDDRDHPSKQMLSFLLILLSLTDVDPGKAAPIITIPAN